MNVNVIYDYSAGLNVSANATLQFDYNDVLFHDLVYKTIVPVLFALIIITGLTGNVLVVLVILLEKKRRTSVNILLLNLAITDILFLVGCVPFMAYHYAAEKWELGDVICKLSQFLLYVTVYVTASTLVAIALLRLLVVAYAKTALLNNGNRGVCVIIGLIWSTMLVANSPVLIWYRVTSTQYNASPPYYYCAMDKQRGQKVFVAFLFASYIVPLSVITVCYFLLLRHIRQHHQHSIISGNSIGSRELASHASNLIFVVVAVFAACWLPLNIQLVYVFYAPQPKSRIYEVLRFGFKCLAYSNSMMNPIIYHFISKDFRKSFKRIFLRCQPCTRNESGYTNGAPALIPMQGLR